MNKIYFITTNRGKAITMSNVMKGYGIDVVQVQIDTPEPRSDDVKLIAKEKALYGFKKINKPCIAMDAGFYIKSLNGFPKAFVNHALSTIGIDGILTLTKDKNKECEFRECIAYLDKRLSKPMCFNRTIKGSLTSSRRGTMKKFLWSELCLIFIPQGRKKTLAQMTEKELYSWGAQSRSSHEKRFARFFLNRK